MVESKWNSSPLICGLATFHTVFFMAILVMLTYINGVLGPLLESLNTLAGIGFFILLWSTTGWCTRRALQSVELKTPNQFIGFREVRDIAMKWGGWNGIYFLGGLLLFGSIGIGVYTLVTEPWSEDFLGFPFFLLLGFGLGAVPAFFVGSIIGAIFSVIDYALIELSRFICVSCFGKDVGSL